MINRKKVKRYCKDDISLIENYSEAVKSPETWVCHHRLETTLNGEAALSPNELIRLDMYYKRPYFELIFMKKSDHNALHNSIRIWSEASKEKARQSKVGKPSKVKGRPKSEEARKHMSEAQKGHIPWNKGKKGLQVAWNKGMRFKS